MRAFAGVDWAAEKADVMVQDQDGGVLLERAFAMDEAGIAGLCETLLELAVCPVAIERPDGCGRAAAGRRSDGARDASRPGRGRPAAV